MKEFKRVLEDIKLDKNEIINKCKEDVIFAEVLAGIISINSSRQGTKDEKLQIDICNEISSQLGINIKNLKVNDFRPSKTGCIIDAKGYKTTLKNECLKYFDGQISCKIDGWIFVKVVYGNGLHQDNVFEGIYPGQKRTITWTIHPQHTLGTNWYHVHHQFSILCFYQKQSHSKEIIIKND